MNKFRYKKRKDWSKNERTFFKICNFIVLSRKRIKKVFEAFDSLEKLSNKSHYQYTENDINLLKGIILENLEDKLKNFNKDLSIFKDSDIEIFQNHLDELKAENLRLENENKRLQFIIENFVKEKEISEIDDIKSLVSKNIPANRKLKTSLKNEKINFSKENIRKFLKLWSEGKTTAEIVNIYKNKRIVRKRRKKKVEDLDYFLFFFSYMPTKSSGAIIKGGNPASLVQFAIMDLKKGNKNFGHSISNILSRTSSVAFSIVKIPQYTPSTMKSVESLVFVSLLIDNSTS